MKTKEIENELSNLFSKYYKEVTGRGPIDISTNIVGHTIYMKMNCSFTLLEKSMYQFIIDHNGMQVSNTRLLEEGKKITNKLLEDFGFPINTEDTLVFPDIEREYVYLILILNENLEKEIRKLYEGR
ncbi:Na-translocating system protein MpsC family protein [Aquibacillus salsiterrae]|uniref:Na-translocating system protein MpsC family protein n=1 Tax=Aquibacillus salsiterrae TaxID=2950439 RepID=A0A9X3WB72_9BACI|nr:Na-translocating system protein MpsC family protein [Aquibacillus salsiterrae]MDC3415842.1 Na-translocating system protein MpsC family protein [Aquibacillus salsiterrae]